jgi:Putative Actinobacterial Holin-X, holin superfamily III
VPGPLNPSEMRALSSSRLLVRPPFRRPAASPPPQCQLFHRPAFRCRQPNIPGAMTNEQSGIVDLLKILRDDATTLVRDEISLAKTEISEKIASTSRNVGYLAAGALVAYAALILILQGISLLLRDLFILGAMIEASASLLGFSLSGP